MGYEAWIDVPTAARPRATISSRRFALVILAAATIAVLLRFPGLGSRSLWLDEAYSAWFSGLGWSELWFDTPKYETHPPTYYSLLKLWRALWGDGAAALRSFSAVVGIAAIVPVAFAARDLGRLTSSARPFLLVVLACTLMAISPRLVMIGQDARPYALMLLAYAGALLCWLRLTRSFRDGDAPEGRAGDWMGLGSGTALVLWLHGLGILFAAALLGALLLTAAPGASPARGRRLAATVVLVALSYIPCLAMMMGRSGDWGTGWLEWDPARFPGALLDLFGLHRLEEPVTPFAARVLMAALLFLGLRTLWRRGDRPLTCALGLLLLFPPLAAALISQAGFPLFLPRTLVAVLVPAYLIAAFAVAQLPLKQLTLAAGALGLLFAANLVQVLVRPSLEGWNEAANVLKREMKPGDVIWAYPNDVALPLERALGGSSPIQAIPAAYPALKVEGSRRLGSPAVVTIDSEQARKWAADHPASGSGTIWLVWIDSALSNPDGDIQVQLASGRQPGRRYKWGSLKLQQLDAAGASLSKPFKQRTRVLP